MVEWTFREEVSNAPDVINVKVSCRHITRLTQLPFQVLCDQVNHILGRSNTPDIDRDQASLRLEEVGSGKPGFV